MIEQFKKDVDTGLSAQPKHLSSKYFYDDIGSQIFQKIMAMPEYYLTDSEFEILSLQAKQIAEKLNFYGTFNIIELGAGDGYKTIKLLKNFIELGLEFTYIPVDISKKAIDILLEKVAKEIPDLKVKPFVGDYFKLLSTMPNDIPSLVLFLGSNIGNFKKDDAQYFLKSIQNHLKPNDKLLIGFDLQKNPITIKNAYDDPHGITKAFNMNLLHRINNELGADFRLDKFDFYCHYNPVNGEVRSYLVSLKQQDVYIKSLDKSYSFDYNELIWTELSKKYSFTEIESFCTASKFKLTHNFLDCKHYFIDSLWSV
ncbi:L-histidine N(alpha)-methyltransferase [Polaribacter ponticola]|uniref:L-histidine N(Alpha)-methyltransferase n=1 Tax=Polaribacter ponticola TaxID=2978475 RepID=A0ABT5S7G1_9FLAO|nr:L-histidine N(alpha)-methyltransferase [Polaribacter sp. MSW5]MDD7914035.1 L-histidine N(alpha)-methyltransferase [Polaribacter sp. MSW5]